MTGTWFHRSLTATEEIEVPKRLSPKALAYEIHIYSGHCVSHYFRPKKGPNLTTASLPGREKVASVFVSGPEMFTELGGSMYHCRT